MPSSCYIGKVVFSAGMERLLNASNENNTTNLRPSSNDNRKASE
jgi:hypothetical protein